MWITCEFLHKKQLKAWNMWILTDLLWGNTAFFNRFLLKKDINLLYLHRKWKLWIKCVKSSLSENKNPQRV